MPFGSFGFHLDTVIKANPFGISATEKYPVGWRLCINRSISLPFTLLLLPPEAITTLLRAAISYSPSPSRSLAIHSLVNRFQVVQRAIMTSNQFIFYTGLYFLCYNIATSYTPPMAVGRLELPRAHRLTVSQAQPVCQFQHTAFENMGEGKSLPASPSPKPQLKNTRGISFSSSYS
jgi:hypothetical protein